MTHPITRWTLLLSLVALTCACRKTPPPADIRIRIATAQEPDVLLPLFSDAAGAAQVVECGQRQLTHYAPDGTVQPGLALRIPSGPAEVKEQDGGLNVVWTLRPDLKWTDGAPVTAHDVVAGHRLFMDPLQQVRDRSMAQRVAWMKANDDHTLTVQWKEPYAFFHAYRNHVVLPRALVDRLAADGGALPDLKAHPYGKAPLWMGPWALAEWVPGSFLRMVPAPHAGVPPLARELVWQVVANEQGALAALESGVVDAIAPDGTVTADAATELATRRKDLVAHLHPGMAWAALGINHEDPWLSNARVREALLLAMDRKAAVDAVFRGRHAVAQGLFPPRHAGFVADALPPVNRAQAERLLDEAGFARGRDGVRRAPDGTPMVLEVAFAAGIKASLDLMTVLAQQLGDVGITLKLDGQPVRTLMGQTLRERKYRHLAVFALTWDPMSYADTVLGTAYIPTVDNGFTGQNHGAYRNAEVDGLVARIPRTLDAGARATLLQQLNRVAMREVAVLPLYTRPVVSMTRAGFEQWKPTGTPTPVCWNAEAWTLGALPQ